jgi:cell division septal protein FtsQ
MRKRKRVKIKKPFYKKRNFWIFFSLIPLFTLFFYFIFFSNFFLVKKIEILGLTRIKEEEMRGLIYEKLKENFLRKENIFLADYKKIEREILEKFPQAGNVKISRKFPDEILVKIKERRGIFLLCDKACYLVDEKGIIFEKGEGRDLLRIEKEGFSNFILGEEIISENLALKILKIKEECEKLKIKINKILISDEKLEAETTKGWEIIFSSEKDIDFQIKKLKAVWENLEEEKKERLEYLDLRFGDFAFPKYRIEEK